MSAFRCSGEAAAFEAGRHDMCACADCHRHFPGGSLRCYPHGNICEECHEDRQDAGITREAFGESPRQPAPATPLHRDPLYRHYQDCIAKAFAYGFVHFGQAIKVIQAREFGLPMPAPLAPRPSFMPEPGTPAGDDLAAYYDRPGYKGD